jgi:carboxyl-terminal processing protease
MKNIIEFMKRNYRVLLVVGILAAGLWSFIPSQKASGDEKDKRVKEFVSKAFASIVGKILSHYLQTDYEKR